MDAKSHNGLDALALIVAIALHVALIAALLLQGTTRQPLPEPKRITVNFAEEVGMTSTAPDPVQESQASVAPELGDAAPPPDRAGRQGRGEAVGRGAAAAHLQGLGGLPPA